MHGHGGHAHGHHSSHAGGGHHAMGRHRWLFVPRSHGHAHTGVSEAACEGLLRARPVSDTDLILLGTITFGILVFYLGLLRIKYA